MLWICERYAHLYLCISDTNNSKARLYYVLHITPKSQNYNKKHEQKTMKIVWKRYYHDKRLRALAKETWYMIFMNLRRYAGDRRSLHDRVSLAQDGEFPSTSLTSTLIGRRQTHPLNTYHKHFWTVTKHTVEDTQKPIRTLQVTVETSTVKQTAEVLSKTLAVGDPERDQSKVGPAELVFNKCSHKNK